MGLLLAFQGRKEILGRRKMHRLFYFSHAEKMFVVIILFVCVIIAIQYSKLHINVGFIFNPGIVISVIIAILWRHITYSTRVVIRSRSVLGENN